MRMELLAETMLVEHTTMVAMQNTDLERGDLQCQCALILSDKQAA